MTYIPVGGGAGEMGVGGKLTLDWVKNVTSVPIPWLVQFPDSEES